MTFAALKFECGKMRIPTWSFTTDTIEVSSAVRRLLGVNVYMHEQVTKSGFPCPKVRATS